MIVDLFNERHLFSFVFVSLRTIFSADINDRLFCLLPVPGKQPKNGDGIRRVRLEDGDAAGVRLEGLESSARVGPGPRSSGQRTDRRLRLHDVLPLRRMSAVRLRAEVQADGQEVRGERRSPIRHRRVSQPRRHRCQEVSFRCSDFRFINFSFILII